MDVFDICMLACMQACIYVCMYVCIHACMYLHTFVVLCMCIYVFKLCMCVELYIPENTSLVYIYMQANCLIHALFSALRGNEQSLCLHETCSATCE